MNRTFVGLFALAVAALFSGCSLTLDYKQCNADGDCAARAGDGGTLYCTSDHLCVNAMPEERLCRSASGMPDPPGAFVIASLMARDTGDLPVEDAVRLAVEQINTMSQGAMQAPIALHLCRAGGTDETLRSAKHAVEALGARAFIGPTTSDAVVAITPYAVLRDVLVVSPSATAIGITSLQDHNLVWRTAPSDGLQAQVLSKLVRATPAAMNAAVVVDTLAEKTVYASGLANAFFGVYHAGGDTTFKSAYEYAPSPPSDMMTKLGLVNTDRPTHALLVADVTAPQLLALVASQQNLATTQLFMTDAAKNPTLFGTLAAPTDKTVLTRIRGTAPATPSGNTYDLFKMKYQAAYSMDPGATSFTANAYDATFLVAIAAAVTTDHLPTGSELAATLMTRILSTGAAVAVGPDSYLPAVKAARAGGVHLEGTSSLLEFDAQSGDITRGTFEVWTVDTSQSPPVFKSQPPP